MHGHLQHKPCKANKAVLEGADAIPGVKLSAFFKGESAYLDHQRKSPGSVIGPTPSSPERFGKVGLRQISPRIYVVLPAYNEAASMASLLRRLATLEVEWGRPLTVCVIDDGSSDGTAAIAEHGWSDLEVDLRTHAQNRGLGQAVHSGLRAVLELADDNDVVVVMDADELTMWA